MYIAKGNQNLCFVISFHNIQYSTMTFSSIIVLKISILKITIKNKYGNYWKYLMLLIFILPAAACACNFVQFFNPPLFQFKYMCSSRISPECLICKLLIGEIVDVRKLLFIKIDLYTRCILPSVCLMETTFISRCLWAMSVHDIHPLADSSEKACSKQCFNSAYVTISIDCSSLDINCTCRNIIWTLRIRMLIYIRLYVIILSYLLHYTSIQFVETLYNMRMI